MKNHKRGKMIKLFLLILTVVICCGGGYYIWCSHHPEIYIIISDGPTGKDGIVIEAPHISYAQNENAEPVPSITSSIESLIKQHEELCEDVRSHYQTADIKLSIQVDPDEMILRYTGTATTLHDETIEFRKDIHCDFVLDATISHKMSISTDK